MADIIELGKKVKAKFPGQYDDLNDEEVGRRVKAKHPGAYDDYVDLPQPAEPRSVGGFAKNVLKSGANLVGDVAGGLLHPLDTLGAIGSIPVGLYEKAGGPVPDGWRYDASKSLDAMADHFGKRYGSMDGVGETLYNDPVGALADASTVLTGGAGAARAVGAVARAVNATGVAAKAGKVAAVAGRAAELTDPLAQGVRAAGAAGRGIVGSQLADAASKRLYQSSLKPPPGDTRTKLRDIDKLMETGLDEGIPVTAGGYSKLHGLVDQLNDAVRSRITRGSNEGVTIDPRRVAERTRPLRQAFAEQVNPGNDLATIDNATAEYLNKHTRDVTTEVTPARFDPNGGTVKGIIPAQTKTTREIVPTPALEAQAEKVATYRQLKGKSYGELKGAEVEAQKALARGLKEELVSAFPEIGELNARESRLLGLEEALNRAVKRINNRENLPVGSLSLASLKAIIDSPTIKSHVAIAINKAAKSASRVQRPYRRPPLITASMVQSRMRQHFDDLAASESGSPEQ